LHPSKIKKVVEVGDIVTAQHGMMTQPQKAKVMQVHRVDSYHNLKDSGASILIKWNNDEDSEDDFMLTESWLNSKS